MGDFGGSPMTLESAAKFSDFPISNLFWMWLIVFQCLNENVIDSGLIKLKLDCDWLWIDWKFDVSYQNLYWLYCVWSIVDFSMSNKSQYNPIEWEHQLENWWWMEPTNRLLMGKWKTHAGWGPSSIAFGCLQKVAAIYGKKRKIKMAYNINASLRENHRKRKRKIPRTKWNL